MTGKAGGARPGSGQELTDLAAQALRSGDPVRARQLLDDAAAAHLAANDLADAAAARAFAGQLYRMAGDIPAAFERGAQAADEARRSGDRRALAAAYTSLGEAQLARGAVSFAALSLGRALRFEHDRVRCARLWRRRGAALWASGAPRSAGFALVRAGRMFTEAGDVDTALAVLVERAVALAAVDPQTAQQAREDADRAAKDAGRPDGLAELGMLDAAAAAQAGDLPTARASLAQSRDLALRDVEPLRYVVAVHGLSALDDELGDPVEAYGDLASGWVTLGDLLGRDAARLAFRPALLELREQWGADRFAEVKAAYEKRQRAGQEDQDRA